MIFAMFYLSFFSKKSRGGVNVATSYIVMCRIFVGRGNILPVIILTNVNKLTKHHDKCVLLFYYQFIFGGRMLEQLQNKSGFDLTSKSAFSNENDTFTSRSFAALLAKNNVPASHKRIADNYLIIKKVFKFQACLSRISNVEKALLEKYDFNILEFTTMKQMYDELALLQKWSISENQELREASDNILIIRVKELKFLEASRYASVSNEIYNGYKALEQYLKEISKFQTVETLRTLNF